MKCDYVVLFMGISFGLFGLFFNFIVRPELYAMIEPNIPYGASILIDYFGPVLFVGGGIISLGSMISNEAVKKDDWNAKEEVKKYLESKE